MKDFDDIYQKVCDDFEKSSTTSSNKSLLSETYIKVLIVMRNIYGYSIPCNQEHFTYYMLLINSCSISSYGSIIKKEYNL